MLVRETFQMQESACLGKASCMKEVVSQVEADTAICKALALASKASQELQTRKGPLPSKSIFFFSRGLDGSVWGQFSGGSRTLKRGVPVCT